MLAEFFYNITANQGAIFLKEKSEQAATLYMVTNQRNQIRTLLAELHHDQEVVSLILATSKLFFRRF